MQSSLFQLGELLQKQHSLHTPWWTSLDQCMPSKPKMPVVHSPFDTFTWKPEQNLVRPIEAKVSSEEVRSGTGDQSSVDTIEGSAEAMQTLAREGYKKPKKLTGKPAEARKWYIQDQSQWSQRRTSKSSVGQRKQGQVRKCLSQLHVNSLEAICQNGMGISLDSIISSPTHATCRLNY